MKMFEKQNAMTLLEMMVVLTIMGILTAASFISIPSVDTMNLQADAKKMISDLWLIREAAVATRADYCIRFNGNSYTVYRNACGGGSAEFFKQESLVSTMSSPAAPFDLTWFGFNRLPFYLRGMAFSPASSNNQLTMTLSLKGRSQTVRIFERTGYIK